MILMNDFKADPIELRDAIQHAVSRVIDSGWYVLGNEVIAFEETWSQLCGCAHGVGVGNGMDAIEIGIRAMGIGTGDEVITTPMTAFATVLAILRSGATPVLADICPQTALLDMSSVARCITPRTKAVLLVHLYGQVANMDAWSEFSNEYGIELLEDCAQAHLAEWNGKPAGSFGRFGAYSFYPTKNLGALGDGGMLVTNDNSLAETAASLRNYGQTIRYHHPLMGMNSRLDEIQAAILQVRLHWLEAFTQRRREVAALYHKGITNPCVQPLPPPLSEESHAYHLFVVNCLRRNELQAHLDAYGIQSLIHYPIPVQQQAPCESIRRDPQGLKISETHATQCLSLPCHPYLSDEQVAQVIAAVNKFV